MSNQIVSNTVARVNDAKTCDFQNISKVRKETQSDKVSDVQTYFLFLFSLRLEKYM